ncbi:hypothetical protein HDV00_000261 [Rhizophlyctis rosea]|nr:hypothetical protein HDV00_000261 [Rhizophlyctis rosea]
MNQDDLEDVHAQVNLMGDYYRNARNCVVVIESLGWEQIGHLEGVLNRVESCGGGSMGMWDEDLTEEERNAIKALAKDPWFKRLWTFQEAVLPEKLIFVIAAETSGGDIKSLVLENMGKTFTHILGTNITSQDGRMRYTNTPPGFLECLTDPSGLMDTYLKSNMGGMTIGSVLQHSFTRDCSFPEDRIFGVLGLVPFSVPVHYAGTQINPEAGKIMDTTTVTSVMTAFADFVFESLKSGDVTVLLFNGQTAYNLEDEHKNPLKKGWCPLYGSANWSGIPATPLTIPPTLTPTFNMSLHGKIIGRVHKSTNPLRIGTTQQDMHVFFYQLVQYFTYFGATPTEIATTCLRPTHPHYTHFVSFIDRTLRKDTTYPTPEEFHAFGGITANHLALASNNPVSLIQCLPLSLSPSHAPKPFYGIMGMNDNSKAVEWWVFDLGSVTAFAGVRRWIVFEREEDVERGGGAVEAGGGGGGGFVWVFWGGGFGVLLGGGGGGSF